jgi:hypothetical protein
MTSTQNGEVEIQFPGGSFTPLWSSAFHGALLSPVYVNNQ